MKVATIGIGSNSLRMLLADISSGELRRLKRYREGLRLFAALDQNHCLPPEAIRLACEKVLAFVIEAKREGAKEISIFATSATRDCENREEIASAIQKTTGIKLDICDGDTEARLSYWGAYLGASCALIDIGGGSTEIIFGKEKQVEWAHSFQIGAVRLFREVPILCTEDAFKLRNRLAGEFGRECPCPSDLRTWVGVGGTFKTSVALVTRKPWEQIGDVQGFSLHRNEVEEAIRLLAEMPMEERIRLPYLQPQRADIIVHGLVILLSCFDCFSMPEIIVSEYGNLEGYLKNQYGLLKN